MSRYGLIWIALLACVALVSVSFGQVPYTTNRADNQRTGANVNETLLTPANVNPNQFGALFNYPIDYQALAQPLYMPGVTINGTVHNVVYVATMADSLYAFDADSNTGGNASPLWSVNFTNPAIYGPGITTASGSLLPCSLGKTEGFLQEGVPGTPVIDPTTNTIYLVAKTVENGTVRHRLHALDITNGDEKFGGPMLIQATSTSDPPANHVTTFTSLHQLNRPGLVLQDGTIYIAFGSNGCNDSNTGWMLSYDAATLAQTGVFNTSPVNGLTSVWQTGTAPAVDESGNIFVETGEACPSCFDIPQGGQTYSNSVIELYPSLAVENYFAPYYVAFLNTHDEDLSATGPIVPPDQEGPYPHLLVTGGKQGFVYLLNRDNLGMYAPGDTQILQEFPLIPGAVNTQKADILFSSPAYWNNTVYFAPNASPLLAYQLSPGYLGTTDNGNTLPNFTSAQKYVGAHSPSISANGNTNGVLWNISGGNLFAFNASNLAELYASNQSKSRDTLPAVGHFVTPTVDNGKVYIATQTTLSVYGLFQSLTLVSGGNQSGPILTSLAPIQMQVVNPYTGAGVSGVTVSFGDGGKEGSFNPPSPIVSDANGNVSTTYTLSKTAGVYTFTATAPMTASLTFTETALPGPAKKLIIYTGTKQTGQAGSILPTPLKVKIEDAYNNGVPGVTTTFVDQSGTGTITPSSGIVSNSSGFSQVNYQLPNTAGTYKILASAPGTATSQFVETATYASGTGAVAKLSVVSGNNQVAPENTALAQPLVVQITDAGGNLIPGVSVVFSAPSGTFTGSPATTNSSGTATVGYTTGSTPGPITITAAVNALTTQFTENVSGPAASVTVSGGNNQTGSRGTTLTQALTVVVTDQYGNPVSGVNVGFSDNGAGGSFSGPNPVATNSSGAASEMYTLPANPGTITIDASATGVSNPAVFTETSQ
jgi:hypothetical protein